jgi:hypothetical protein
MEIFHRFFLPERKQRGFFFTFLDNWMTTKILNDCVLFLNNYYDDCFVFEQPTFLICTQILFFMKKTKIAFLTFEFVVFAQFIFLNNCCF